VRLRFSFAVVLMGLCIAKSWGAEVPIQSKASFEAAVGNESTAPLYVAVTVVDDASQASRSTCTTANLLKGAVHLEHGIAYNPAGQKEVQRIILSATDHIFHFTKPGALANIPVFYSQDDLAHVRAQLQGISVAGLRVGFSSRGPLHSIYNEMPFQRRNAYRDATACALIERGLSPGMGDITDQIWIAGVDRTPFPDADGVGDLQLYCSTGGALCQSRH
jgi:hypothetical protein